MPKVSVIVPVYNVEKYLDRCVQSLLNQTLKDIEIILVDDGSPDRCPKLCDEYARLDNRIRVVHKQNGGLGMACNSGMEVATGEYIAFCDSDDWVDADMYETMYDTAIKNHVEMVFTGLKRVGPDNKALGVLSHFPTERLYRHADCKNLMLDIIASGIECANDHEIQVSAKVVLYKKSLIKDNGLLFVSEREYPSEDLIFNVSYLSKCENAIVIPKYFYNYFINTSSITTTLNKNRFNNFVKSIDFISGLLKDKLPENNSQELETRLSKLLLGEARSQCRLIVHSSNTNYTEKRALLHELSENQYLRKAASNYPIDKLPIYQKLVLSSLLGNKINLLMIVLNAHKMLSVTRKGILTKINRGG